MSIEITVNGESRVMSEGQTILDLLGTLGLDPSRVAVELDLSIVKQTRWSETVLSPGAHVEVVTFVGGG
jgi:thiamine biosynthesis protein ThiS